jgi:hypothetical protein
MRIRTAHMSDVRSERFSMVAPHICKQDAIDASPSVNSENYSIKIAILQHLEYCWHSGVEQEHCYRESKEGEHLKNNRQWP